jgi:two-component system cell cycle sensor histidine kinase/response regulator CckA
VGVHLKRVRSGQPGASTFTRKTRARSQPGVGSDRRPEDALRFTQFAVDNLSDAAYWIERDARITYVNAAASRLTGYTREELLGMLIYELNPGITKETWPQVWGALKRAKKRVFETTHRTKAGHLLPVEIAANFLEFDGKEYSCAFARDITDRRQLELRLRQAEKMEALGQLSGGIAHDFNNQLMGIMGYADVLRRRLADEPSLARLAESICRSVHRAAELTANLLAFSRKGVSASEPVDIHRIAADVIDLLAHTLDKRIVIVRRLEAEGRFVLGDPTQLQSAILNLALNARDAMPQGGTLTLSTTNVALDESFGPDQLFPAESGDYVRLTVSDTGEGMDAETRQRVFEPFFTTKASGKGTGLGLPAVYGTIRSHKGTLSLRSEPGRGTEIEVDLPVTPSVPAVTAPSDATLQSRLASARVLLVDDEPVLREVTRQLLEDLGCSVTSFENGEEAVRYYGRCHEAVDLVILDMVMPVMTGRDTFLAMRSVNPRVKALLASGYSVEHEAQATLELGARAFIQKPYDSSALARKLVEVLESK